jgi:ribosomal protein S25
MSNGQSTYLLSIAVDILRHLENTNEWSKYQKRTRKFRPIRL